jgi:hypothetical protein
MKKVLVIIVCILSHSLLYGQYQVTKASKDSLVFEYGDNTFCIAMGKKGKVDINQYLHSNNAFKDKCQEHEIVLNDILESENDASKKRGIKSFIDSTQSKTKWLYKFDVGPTMEDSNIEPTEIESEGPASESEESTSLMTKILIGLAGLGLLGSIVMLIIRFMKPKQEQSESSSSKSAEFKKESNSKKDKTTPQDSAQIKKITKEKALLENQIKEQNEKEQELIQKLKAKSSEVIQLQDDKGQIDKIYNEKFSILAKLMNEFISRNEQIQKDYSVLRDINNFKSGSNFKDFIETSFYLNAYNKEFIKSFSETIQELELFDVKSSAKTLPLNNWEAVNAGKVQKLDDTVQVNSEVLKVNDRIPLGIRNLVKELNKLDIKELKVLVEKYKIES